MIKNLLFAIFTIVCIATKAQFTPATVYFSDGSKKTGLAKFVDSKSKSIRFKTDLKAKEEKIDQELVDKIEYKDKDGNEFIAERLNSWDIEFLKRTYSKKKSWFYKLYDKENFSTYVVQTTSKTNFVGNRAYTTPGSIEYYFRRKGNDTIYLGFIESKGLAVHLSRRKEINAMIEEMFQGRCSKAQKDVEKIEFDYKKRTDFIKVLDILIKNKCK